MRWNAVLIVLGVLLVLDAILIISRDVKLDTSEHKGRIQGVGVLPARMEANSNRKSAAPRMDPPPPPSEEVAGVGMETQEENDDESEAETQSGASNRHKVAGLNCDAYGGPSEKDAEEMVYWQDIPTDASYVSPLKAAGPEVKYLTFEPDEGEWHGHAHFMNTTHD
jgi:hypothetical protein